MQADIIGLIILGICVILFLTKWLPAAATGCLGCLLMVLTKVCTLEEAFSGFSNSIVLLMASAMIVGIAMFKTGAAQIIGHMVIRLSKGHETSFLLMACLVSGILAMFLANTAILAAFIPIIDSVCRTSDNMKRRNLVLPVALSVMFGGSCTLIGCTPQLTANALMSKMVGFEMGMWTLTAPGLILFFVFLAYTTLYGYRNGKKIWGSRPEADMQLDENQVQSVTRTDYDTKRLAVMFVITFLMIISYAFSLLPTAVTAMCAAMLCIIFGCCDVKDIVTKLSWESVVFLAACLGIANGLTAAGSGERSGEIVSSMIGSVSSPIIIFAVLVLLTLFISQFITNSTAIIIVLPIALSLCTKYGFSYMAFCVGITLGASVACCTPLAAAQITMTQMAGYEFSDYAKYCLPLTLAAYLCILVFVPLFFPLV